MIHIYGLLQLSAISKKACTTSLPNCRSCFSIISSIATFNHYFFAKADEITGSLFIINNITAVYIAKAPSAVQGNIDALTP